LFRRHQGKSDDSAKVLFYTVRVFLNNVVGRNGSNNVMATHKNMQINNGNYVLLLDEAHQILEPPPRPTLKAQDALKKQMKTLKEKLLSEPFSGQNVHVWPLTATPASSVPQWLDMLSFVRPVGKPRVPGSAIKAVLAAVRRKSTTAMAAALGTYARGTVFFSDLRGDLRTHACVTYAPKSVALDRYYYIAALAVMQKHLAGATPDVREACRATMYLKPEEYTKVIPTPVVAEIARRHRLLDKKWVSNKFIGIVKDIANVREHRGKVFAYSPHLRGDATVAVLIGKALTAWFGFRDVTRTIIEGPEKPELFVNPTTRPCFVVWGKERANKKVDPKKMTPKAKLRKAFNQANNVFGRQVKLYLACGDEYEGTDLKGIRHLHITEPMLNPLRERQLVGRGVRFCSHAGIRAPTVRVVRWYGTPPTRLADILPHVKKPDAARAALAFHAAHPGGIEREMYAARMRDPSAVDLYNFELFLKKQSVRGFAAQYGDEFIAPAGRRCQ
jgi:hypothetical protein